MLAPLLKNITRQCRVLVFLLLLVGCGADEQSQPSPPPSAIPTRYIAPTLPPIWTASPVPSPTRTPRPSLTPSATLSPTATPTLSLFALCRAFDLTGQPQDAVEVAYAGRIAFAWEGAPPDSFIRVWVSQGGEESAPEIVEGLFPAEMGFNAPFDLTILSGWGLYEWELSLIIGEQIACQHDGTFYRQPWWVQPQTNPLYPSFVK